jgi:nitrate/TMAO reductase-like tetraheme cytochrome c subunit
MMEVFPKRSFLIFLFFLAGNCENKKIDIKVEECTKCHDFSYIISPKSDERKGPYEWMNEKGEGLTRKLSFIPRPLDELGFEWIKRGRHSEDNLYCGECHVLEEGKKGHGITKYPDSAFKSLYKGGTDCSFSCHKWVSGEITSVNYSGTIDPYTLLSKKESAHSKIFREGFMKKEITADLKVNFLPSGCGACHNYKNVFHGWVSSCLDCHSFIFAGIIGKPSRTSLHEKHSSKNGTCKFCHYDEAEPKNAVCYNCHLSGHAPLVFTGLEE